MADNLSKATKKSQYESKVAAMGALGTNANEFSEPSTLLEKAAGDFISRVQQNITDSGMSVTGKSSELTIDVVSDTSLIISAPASLAFQSYGVNGVDKSYGAPYNYTNKRPPVQALKDWIKARQLQSTNNPKYYSKADFEEQDNEEKVNSMAWAISSHIYSQGIKPKEVIQPEIDELIQDCVNIFMGNALGKIIMQIPGNNKRGATRLDAPSSPNPNI